MRRATEISSHLPALFYSRQFTQLHLRHNEGEGGAFGFLVGEGDFAAEVRFPKRLDPIPRPTSPLVLKELNGLA